MLRLAIISSSSGSSSRYAPCSMESTPASTAARKPSPPSAWHITRRPRLCASSTSASSSARSKSVSFGPSPAVELAPPVVAVLTTSAPAPTISRTLPRIASAPSATPHGRPLSSPAGGLYPSGLTRSAMPPVGVMKPSATCRRGPGTSPSSTAMRKPASKPPASRTQV